MFTLENQVCLVTGATRGIGAAIADAIGNAGATVIGTATSESGAEKISERFNNHQISGFGAQLDVRDIKSITELVKDIGERFGGVTCLVNNAGITRDNLLMRMKEAEWDDIMDTNLKSVFSVTKACLRGMTKSRYGRIVNIGSIVGTTGNPGQANYAAAKAGLLGFTKSLAQELAGRNILVNTVAPGFIETDMTNALSDTQKEKLLTSVPLGRLGSPADIANAVLFLLSPAADYITGQTLHVNGGMYTS